MKCPKCGYLGFEQADRCRNCGYDFALAQRAGDLPELPLRPAAKTERFADLSLVAPREEPQAPVDLGADLDRILAVPAAAAPPAARSAPAAVGVPEAVAPPPTAPAPAAAGELPLFGGPITDDVPLITRASPPRPPLAVRRATPEIPRLRAEAPRAANLDLSLDLEAGTAPPSARPRRDTPAGWNGPQGPAEVAGIGARIVAAALDLVVLALVDLVVVYFTMQICWLTPADIALLPKAPLIAFLVLQNVGYLIAFTAGGQTLGKMATGIRVVSADSESSIDVGRATLRTLCWVVLAVPAGLGFLTALFSADHRGLHDRFAGTRVVRASA